MHFHHITSYSYKFKGGTIKSTKSLLIWFAFWGNNYFAHWPHWPSHTWTQLPSERVWWPSRASSPP